MVLGNWIGCSCGSAIGEKGLTKINKDRNCTDIPFLLLFLGVWGAVLAVMGTAINRGGNINKMLHGVDYNGFICGVDASVATMPNVAWPYLSGAPEAVICVADCNQTQSDPRIANYNTYISAQYLNWCLPSTNYINGSLFSNTFASASNSASRSIADLYKCWGVILAGAFIALFLSFVYMKLVEKFAYYLVWASIFLILAGGILICFICFQQYQSAQNSADTTRQQAMMAIGLCCGVLTFLYLCMIIFLRDRITLAIEVTVEAAKVLEDLPLLAFFPLITFVGFAAYIIYWIYVCLLLFSVTTETVIASPTWTSAIPAPYGWPSFAVTNSSATGYKSHDWDSSMQSSLVLHFFHLLWNVEFFRFLTFLSLSGAIANWYFVPYKGDSKPRGDADDQLSDSVIRDSFYRAIRYHLGSICLASLILAVINFIRAWILYLEEKARKADMNETLRCIIFGCINCFLKCVECFMRQINKNGMVFVAVYGSPFCPSAFSAFSLAWANIARVAFVSMVGNFLLGIGVVLVCVFTTGICSMILYSPEYLNNINSPVLPIVIVFIISYCIGTMFMEVYETCIDTVFMCFLIDEDQNKNSGNYLAAPSLRKLIDGNTHNPEKANDAPKVT